MNVFDLNKKYPEYKKGNLQKNLIEFTFMITCRGKCHIFLTESTAYFFYFLITFFYKIKNTTQ